MRIYICKHCEAGNHENCEGSTNVVEGHFGGSCCGCRCHGAKIKNKNTKTMKIDLSICDSRWIGEKVRSYYYYIRNLSTTNKTEALLGAYKTISLLETLPAFRYCKINKPASSIAEVNAWMYSDNGYHKVGEIWESDFIKYCVYHKNDHDDASNVIKLITDDREFDIEVIQ